MGGFIEKMNIISGIDIIFIVLFLLFLFIFIFWLKKERTVALILSIYLGYIFTEELIILNSNVLKTRVILGNVFVPEVLFVASIILFFFLFLRSGFFKRYVRSHYLRKEKVIFLNVLAVGLFVSISIKYFLPAYIGLNLGYFLRMSFVVPLSFFMWMTIPMFSIFLIKRR